MLAVYRYTVFVKISERRVLPKPRFGTERQWYCSQVALILCAETLVLAADYALAKPPSTLLPALAFFGSRNSGFALFIVTVSPFSVSKRGFLSSTSFFDVIYCLRSNYTATRLRLCFRCLLKISEKRLIHFGRQKRKFAVYSVFKLRPFQTAVYNFQKTVCLILTVTLFKFQLFSA